MDGFYRQHGQATLIYVMPALMDLSLALLLFVCSVRAARLSGSAAQVASVPAAWSVVYVVVCPLVGRLMSPRNAHRLVLAGCLLSALVCGLLALATDFPAMLAFVGLGGVSAAMFFPPFQLFMKDLDTAGGRTLAYSTGLYTFAWSTGFACGPFAAGFLMHFGATNAAGGEGPGWRYALLFGAAVGLALSALFAAFLRSRNRRTQQAGAATPAPAATLPGESPPDLAWLGWLAAIVLFSSLSIIRSALPARGVSELHLPESTLGTILFALSMTQALTGLALVRGGQWMYRARPVAAGCAAGLVGLLCFGLGDTPAIFLIGAVSFGIYSGAFSFYMVYHALAHPEHAGRYVAVNESIVGVTGFVAPLIAGFMADAWGFTYPYLAVAALVLAAMAVQVAVHRRNPWSPAASARNTNVQR
ncbi:MAG: MFS transporter [Kiritimatiellae bacterium]|nr:MFS transporter [Kiritimatiellia bacterium]